MNNQDVLAQLATLVAEANNAAPKESYADKMDREYPGMPFDGRHNAGLAPVGSNLIPGDYFEGVGMFGMTCVLVGLICMAVSTAYFYKAAMAKKENRFFEILTMMITGLATLAYLSMYTGAGYFWIAEKGVAGKGREIAPMYYARYLDWITTTPLMIWDVLALAGAPNDDILQCVFIDVLMIAFGCVGAQTPEGQKWYFFIIGMLCYFHVVQTLLKYNKSMKYGEAARALYNKVASMTIVLWSLYPVVWIVAEGLRLISPSLEACCYMIMDVLSKCLFGFFIVGGRTALEQINSQDRD